MQFQRFGDYTLVNPDEKPVIHFNMVRLTEEAGILIFEVDSDLPDARGKIVLRPLNDDAAVIVGANRLAARTVPS